MNILRVIGSMNPSSGGPCQGIRNSIAEMEKLNVRTEVISLDDPADVFPVTDPFLVHLLGPAKNSWKYSKKLLPWLVENIHRFDVIIIHGLWLYHGYAVNKALSQVIYTNQKRKKPRLYLMPHGMLDPYFQKASGRKLKAIRNWIYWKFIESEIVNRAEGILFTCEAELQLARQPFSPYKPKREINVGYGIPEPPVFTPAMKETLQEKGFLSFDDPYFLFLSRIHQKKGVDLLIKAYIKLLTAELPAKSVYLSGRSTMPNIPKLVIAGPGMETEYGEYLLQIISQYPYLKDLFVFPGMLTGDAKWGAFYGCEAFILPSHQENFGIAVVEALACSKPVLISNQVNIWQEIESERGGIVAPDTLKGTSQLLESWLTLPDHAKKDMSERARSTYQKYFSIKPAALHLYQALTKDQ